MHRHRVRGPHHRRLSGAMADEQASLTQTVQQARDNQVLELERVVWEVAKIQQSLEEK